MCFGKPIISAQYGNEAEYVQNGINGLNYVYGDVGDLSKKIMILLNDKVLRKKLGSESDRIVREQINVHHMVSVLYTSIKKVFRND
jgi:glycosyltransferase involved in cell wall biosynthesis